MSFFVSFLVSSLLAAASLDEAPHGLYPEIEPYQTGTLKVDDIHTLYWEQCGNPDGIPILFLHGGPGLGAPTKARQFFDPAAYRAVLFDQRGCGRSTPLGELQNNTTLHLIADIEALRSHLLIEKWVVFGGSWGSTLAIAYGQKYPEKCLAMILRGVYLGRPIEGDWFYAQSQHVYPDFWDRFVQYIPQEEQGDLLTAYATRIMDPDPSIHLPAALEWNTFESVLSTINTATREDIINGFRAQDLTIARLEIHYFTNNLFLPTNSLMEGIERLRSIPWGIIVQGRYDMVCPMRTAYDVAKKWPEAELVIVSGGGHSAFEDAMQRALVKACDEIREKISPTYALG